MERPACHLGLGPSPTRILPAQILSLGITFGLAVITLNNPSVLFHLVPLAKLVLDYLNSLTFS